MEGFLFYVSLNFFFLEWDGIPLKDFNFSNVKKNVSTSVLWGFYLEKKEYFVEVPGLASSNSRTVT